MAAQDQKATDPSSAPSQLPSKEPPLALPSDGAEEKSFPKSQEPESTERPLIKTEEVSSLPQETKKDKPVSLGGTPPPVSPSPPSPSTPPPPPPSTPVKTTLAKEPVSFSPSSGSKFKKVSKFLLVLLVFSLLAGAAYFLWPILKKEKLGGEKTLTYWGLWESEEAFGEIIRDWEKEHPKIKINYIRQAKEEYRERLQSALARGEGPDVFRFHNTWLPMFKDELTPLPSSVMNAAQFEETFYPVAVSDLRIGASIYGLPLEIDTLALFYNEDLLRAAGKEPPTNWDELRELARMLTVRDANDRIQIAGIAMGGTANIDHWSDILGLMVLQNGADLDNPKGKLVESALVFYSYFLKRDQVWSIHFPNSTLAFAGGKAAMYFGFSWDVFEIKRANPDLKFKIVSVPQLPEREPVAWASYWVEGVAKRSSHQKEAWEFLEYLTSKEVMRKFYQIQTKGRIFGEPYSRKDLASELLDDPLVAPFIKQAPFAKSWYLCSRTFDNGLNETMIKYFEDAVNAVNEGKKAEKILETTAKGVTQTLARYRVSK